jgi:protein-ribulosamine 3-kinase
VSTSYPHLLDELGLGPPARLDAVGGGCIAQAQVATFRDGTKAFVKRAAGQPDMFPREAEGLQALADARAIRVPRVLVCSEDALVLEWVETGPRRAGFFAAFGRAFARLHEYRGPCCGFPHDNFIGSTPQINRPLQGSWGEAQDPDGRGWPEFFLERRLRFQTRLARESGHGAGLDNLLDSAEHHIAGLLAQAPEPPSLLHGDLWGGNYMCDERGEACLIDPAAYYGHREADLAMTRLFGGFDADFYRGYEEALPLAPGAAERLPVYQLYHLLNHLNLFGSSYYRQCQSILQRFT